MSPLVLTEARTDAEWQAVRAIRQTVFVEEQACPPEDEWDAYDAAQARGVTVHHLLGTVGGEPAACGRWRPIDRPAGAAKLERFAVLPLFRGYGLGREIIAATMAEAREAGHARLVLHAQIHLASFYKSLGFEAVGYPFWEAGIEHVKMQLAG